MNYFTPNKNFIRKNFSTELNCNPNIILWFEIDSKTLNEHEKEEKSKRGQLPSFFEKQRAILFL